MSEIIQNWKFSEDLVEETSLQAAARIQSAELNQSPVSPSMGKQIALLTKISSTKNTVEIGMGSAVSGLYTLEGSPDCTITSIDPDPMVHDAAKKIYQQSPTPSGQLRFITGKPEEVLPRLNDASYDMFLFNATRNDPLELFEHGLRLTSDRGIILVTNILLNGKLAQPANREDLTKKVRELIQVLQDQNTLSWNIIPTGSGLLQITK